YVLQYGVHPERDEKRTIRTFGPRRIRRQEQQGAAAAARRHHSAGHHPVRRTGSLLHASVKILDRFRLDGKTALVTGARRGIGKALAVALAQAGADIIGTSAEMESEGSDAGNAVERCGRRFRGYACDLADRKSVYAFIEQVKLECAPVDILV